jgi:hypothetical protein
LDFSGAASTAPLFGDPVLEALAPESLARR